MTRSLAGTVVQVNISPGGVPKRPILRGVVTPTGLVGDSWAHPRFHGGPKQALLLISEEGLSELIGQGFQLFPGALGENITTRGLDRRMMRLGQTYQIGSALIELTKVRIPCETIERYGAGIGKAVYDKDVKAGDMRSPRWGLSGFYARVTQPGEVSPNDTITLIDQVV